MALNAIPTRLKLPVEQIDALIAAGGQAVHRDRGVRHFSASVQRGE